jgi:hypothetical protein
VSSSAAASPFFACDAASGWRVTLRRFTAAQSASWLGLLFGRLWDMEILPHHAAPSSATRAVFLSMARQYKAASHCPAPPVLSLRISVRVCDEPLKMCCLKVLLGNSQGAFVRAYLCNVCHVTTHSCAPGVRRRRVFCCPSALMELELHFWSLFSICWRHDCFRTFSRFLKLHFYQLQRHVAHRQRYVRRVLPSLCTRALKL